MITQIYIFLFIIIIKIRDSVESRQESYRISFYQKDNTISSKSDLYPIYLKITLAGNFFNIQFDRKGPLFPI